MRAGERYFDIGTVEGYRAAIDALRPTVLAYYVRGVINLFYNAFIFHRADRGVADLTTANPNVYLEIGYAWGMGKPTVLLPLLIADHFWDAANNRVHAPILAARDVPADESWQVGISTDALGYLKALYFVHHGQLCQCL